MGNIFQSSQRGDWVQDGMKGQRAEGLFIISEPFQGNCIVVLISTHKFLQACRFILHNFTILCGSNGYAAPLLFWVSPVAPGTLQTIQATVNMNNQMQNVFVEISPLCKKRSVGQLLNEVVDKW